MQIKGIAISLVLGLSLPIVADVSIQNQAVAKLACLIGAKASGTQARPVFSWTNAKYKYRVSWQTVQPELVRLEVINPANPVILNQFLVREPGEFEDPNATKC